MAIDWTTVVVTFLGLISSGGIGSLIALKYSKRKARTEADSAANQEQAERIDLGDKYVNQMLAMLEKLQTAQEQNLAITKVNSYERKESLDAVSKKMEEIHDVVADVNSEVSSIVQYLNGGYRQYKAEHPKLKSLGVDHDDTDNK
jgi:uncharacterized phage infection (PIP) family protein YhgE